MRHLPGQHHLHPLGRALPDQSSTQFFDDQLRSRRHPLPGRHPSLHPQLRSGRRDNTAGAHSPFSLDLTRHDGDQYLSALNVKTPPGFSATLKGIPYCPEAAIAAAAEPPTRALAEQANPSCPAASQVGTVIAGAGAGTHPLYAPGKVYLAGPYKGAPLSLVVVIPAVSGPYDLGNVVVRTPSTSTRTAQVSAVSDPLPQIIEGIPLRMRSILVNLDRPNFTLNPTNCDPLLGQRDDPSETKERAQSRSSHFQVANCADLPSGRSSA